MLQPPFQSNKVPLSAEPAKTIPKCVYLAKKRVEVHVVPLRSQWAPFFCACPVWRQTGEAQRKVTTLRSIYIWAGSREKVHIRPDFEKIAIKVQLSKFRAREYMHGFEAGFHLETVAVCLPWQRIVKRESLSFLSMLCLCESDVPALRTSCLTKVVDVSSRSKSLLCLLSLLGCLDDDFASLFHSRRGSCWVDARGRWRLALWRSAGV